MKYSDPFMSRELRALDAQIETLQASAADVVWQVEARKDPLEGLLEGPAIGHFAILGLD